MAVDPIPALKRQLADEILASVEQLNFFIAADVLEIDQARLSDLRHGRIARFSVERLIRILATIDRRVTLQITNTGAPKIQWFRLLSERRAQRRSSASDRGAASAGQ